MEDVVKVASYICERYKITYGRDIDEMKLHKLLYFAQRECYIQYGEPLFEAHFEAWKYGPVVIKIRNLYKMGLLNESLSPEAIQKYQVVMNSVFRRYASKDSWSLSTLVHMEASWQNARRGMSSSDSSNALLSEDDIRHDAEIIKNRRLRLSGKID